VGSVAVIGAGPYGLSLASYLRRAGVDTHVFGEPMESWHKHMPEGMRLRSTQVATHIADPTKELSIEAWAAETKMTPEEPMLLSEFLSYGHWFQQKAVPDVDRRRVRNVEPAPGGFSLRTDDEEHSFERVVVATGIAPFALRPPPFAELPAELVSHCADHPKLGKFAGKSVLVVGGGQSALETAALLKEAGANPHLIVRAQDVTWLPPHDSRTVKARVARVVAPPTDVGGPRAGWFAAAPGVLRSLPPRTQAWVYRYCTAPLGAAWLRPRLAEVPIEAGRRVTTASPNGDSVRVTLDDGTERSFDRVVLGTGYRIDVSRYEFLADGLLGGLETVGGSARELGAAPRLGRGLESSVAGLHFAGAAAAATFGPIMRFVVGTWYAAPTISHAISGKRQRPMHLAYRPRARSQSASNRGRAAGEGGGDGSATDQTWEDPRAGERSSTDSRTHEQGHFVEES